MWLRPDDGDGAHPSSAAYALQRPRHDPMRAVLATAVAFGLLAASCAPRLTPGVVDPLLATPSPTDAAQAAATSADATNRAVVGVAAPLPPGPLRTPTPAYAATPAHTPTPEHGPLPTHTPTPEEGLLSAHTPMFERAPTPLPVLDGLLDGLLPRSSGDDYGLVVEDLNSGARAAVNDQQVFPSASLYKLGLAWLILRRADSGDLSLDDPLPIEAEDSVEPEPRGGVAPGETPTVREALSAMLSVSSNAAAHAFLRVVERGEFNQQMLAIGLPQTRVPEDDEADDANALAVTSAADIAHLLRLIMTTQALSASNRDALLQPLANVASPDALRDTLPTSVDILDKTGNLADASNVAALLQSARATVILVVLDRGVNPVDARGVIAQVGEVAYQALLQPTIESATRSAAAVRRAPTKRWSRRD